MRTVIIGLDAFDPAIFERLYEAGRMPNLGRFVEKKAYSHFAVSNPPQSEVSWTSIATGLGPGEHGMFDFVHRDPQNYSVFASLLPTKKTVAGTQFAPPFTAKTLFETAVTQGYPATSLWWPATFPARPQTAVRTIPGLGTPDILGKLGVGACFSNEINSASPSEKVPVYQLKAAGNGRWRGALRGPLTKSGQAIELEFNLEMNGNDAAVLNVGKQRVALQRGKWSPVIELSFKAGRFFKIRAITRVIVTKSASEVSLYVLPLQIHPLKSPWPYATPGGFVKQTWQESGPFLTLGWPQDTTALEESYINDEQFLALCESIFDQRKKSFLFHLAQFQEGVLACVFDTVDRIQHMFLRDRPEIVEAWYERCDRLVGEAMQSLARLKVGKKTRIIILSDHGFTEFNNKVNLNRWLIDSGYLSAPGVETSPTLRGINWQKSSAYALGLNSLYLNLAGREGKGSVEAADKEALIQKLREELLNWQGADDSPVVAQALPGRELFAGSLVDYAPDLFVGYSSGYRASQATGLGGWLETSLEQNHDHWGADHCMHAAAVPGVIFASHDLLRDLPFPSYRDVPFMATGIGPEAGSSALPPTSSGDEDDAAVEERLRSLGYL